MLELGDPLEVQRREAREIELDVLVPPNQFPGARLKGLGYRMSSTPEAGVIRIQYHPVGPGKRYSQTKVLPPDRREVHHDRHEVLPPR